MGESGRLARASLVGSARPPFGRQGTACGTRPRPPRMHYSEPSALSASLLGCLADLQPAWLCPRTAEVVGGCPGAHRCPGELLGGSVTSPAPHSPLSPRTACGLRTPRGTWPGLCHIPLQLQPALSKFLCLMQGGETTQVSKGRAHGALSCWAGGTALPWSIRVTCRLSWAVEEPLWCPCRLNKAREEGLEHAWSCMGVAVNGSAT